MASINGVQIKKLKYFQGMEGDTAQGVIWINNKEQGFWSQDGYGAVNDIFEFDTELLNEKVSQYKKGFKNKDCLEAESLLYHLLMLMEDEKIAKPSFKDGYETVFIMCDGIHRYGLSVPENLTKEEFLEEYKDLIKEGEEKLFKGYTHDKTRVYHSLDDFKVVIDENHPAPLWMD